VLVTGEPFIRLGFQAGLRAHTDFDLVADHAEARAAFPAIDAEKPDVVIVDLALPGMNGISATREIKRRAPGVRVVLLAGYVRERDALEGFAAGADGLVLKTDPVDAVLEAVRSVGHGTKYLSPELRGVAIDRLRAGREAAGAAATPDVLAPLSPREREVLDLLLKGWRNRAIARELCVSIKTVDTHRTRINRKLGCAGSPDLIRFAADNGLLRGVAAPEPEAPAGARTVVLLVDDNPEVQSALLRDAAAPGRAPARASSAAVALREVAAGQGACLITVEGSGPLRAVAALASEQDRDRFVAALDREAAERRPPVDGGDAPIAAAG